MRTTTRLTRHPRLGRLVATAMIVAMAMLAVATSAGAAAGQEKGARFTYEMCDPALPGGNQPAYTLHTERDYGALPDCSAPGGYLGITQWGPVSEGPGWIETSVPATPGGFVESATLTAFASNIQPGATAHVAVEGFPPADGAPTAQTFFIQNAPPECFLCAGSDGWSFDETLTCTTSCPPGGTVGVQYIAATEVDPHPPVVANPEGTALSGNVLRGHQTLTAKATDEGGGLSVLEALVNGTVMPGATEGGCQTTAVRNPSLVGVVAYSPTPCPPALSASWDLNTSEAPFHEGANTIQVCASDFATTGEPNKTCSQPQTVEVDNSCTESAVAGGQVLNASLQGAGEAETLPFEHQGEVTGELTDTAGDPIAGATICVQAQVAETGTAPQPIATATTDAAGTFTYAVPPGPNRRLLVGYRHDSFQVAKTLTLGTHAKPTIHLSKGRVKRGGQVQITGSLPGPQAAGRVVVLQASSLHGVRWLTFRRATTGPEGGFRSAYRFGGTSSTTTYRMRVVVPRQSGYPYEPGHSTPKRVKVLGPGAAKTDAKNTHGGRK
jgi:hypothetical protein